MTKSIMIVGVGGQGTLLASKVLGELFTRSGYDVKVSEVHGMSQRGGSVVTYVRFGDKVYSPIVEVGEADYIISFELLEAARWCQYLKAGDGVLITNTQSISPMPVILGSEVYPENILEKLQSNIDGKIEAIDAQFEGFEKAVNIVLLGKLSQHFDFAEESWIDAIKACVKEQFIQMNIEAFMLGRNN